MLSSQKKDLSANVDLSMTQQAIDFKQPEKISPGMTSWKGNNVEKKHKKMETTVEAANALPPAGTFL